MNTSPTAADLRYCERSGDFGGTHRGETTIMGLADQFKEDLEAIKKAKLTFLIGFLALAALIAWSEYSFIFKEVIARKDDVIRDKDATITTLRGQLSAEHDQKRETPQAAPQISLSPRATVPRTGNAITAGPYSPAITGNGNTTSYGTPDKDKR